MNFWAPIFEEARRYQQEFVDNLRNFLNTLDDDHADQWHNQLSSLLWRWELRGLRITDKSRKDLYDLLVEIAPPGALERALLARLAFQKQLAEKAAIQAAAKASAKGSLSTTQSPAASTDAPSNVAGAQAVAPVQLAQAQPIPPAGGAAPAPQPAGPFGNAQFGTFQNQPVAPGTAPWRVGSSNAGWDPVVKQWANPLAVQVNNNRQVLSVYQALTKRGVQFLFTASFADANKFVPIGGPSADVGGKYLPNAGTIVLPMYLYFTSAKQYKINQYAWGNLKHEIGHALDHMTNGSVSQAFLQAFNQDLANIPKSPKNNATELEQFIPERYEHKWTDEVRQGRLQMTPAQMASEAPIFAGREVFAQAFAAATWVPGEPESPQAAAFRRHFQQTINFMSQYLRTNYP